jgi:hypothetical protein
LEYTTCLPLYEKEDNTVSNIGIREQIRFEAIMASEYNEVFSGDQPCEYEVQSNVSKTSVFIIRADETASAYILSLYQWNCVLLVAPLLMAV